MPELAILGRGLKKRYGRVEAVAGIDLLVNAGTCVGVVGRNGAGKSTIMRMLTTVSPPTEGVLEILGEPARRHSRRIKARLGVVPQTNTLDGELSVFKNVELYARYFGMTRGEARRAAAQALEFARIADRAEASVATLSGGMKRRLTIARALVNDPALLLLDEPTASLDAQSKHAVWETLGKLRSQGRTTLLMSHDMEEVQTLCDHVYIMQEGRFVAQGSTSDLIHEHCRNARLEVSMTDPTSVNWPAVLGDPTLSVDRTPRGVAIEVDDGEKAMALLGASGLVITSAAVRATTLEDVFLRVTGRTAD